MTYADFQEQLKATFKTVFPNGYINVSPLHLGSGISIFCGLIGDRNDLTNNIRHNDPLTFRSFCHDFKADSKEEITGKITIEFDGVFFSCIPDNKYMAMRSEKIQVRKINNTPEKVLESMKKTFIKVNKNMQALAIDNQIYNQDSYNLKYFNM